MTDDATVKVNIYFEFSPCDIDSAVATKFMGVAFEEHKIIRLCLELQKFAQIKFLISAFQIRLISWASATYTCHGNSPSESFVVTKKLLVTCWGNWLGYSWSLTFAEKTKEMYRKLRYGASAQPRRYSHGGTSARISVPLVGFVLTFFFPRRKIEWSKWLHGCLLFLSPAREMGTGPSTAT